MTRPTCLRAACLGAACVVLGLFGAALVAQEPAAFRVERPIASTVAGPQRLAIDVSLLSRAQRMEVQPWGPLHGRAVGGLGDLRIVDASGREVPYLLVYPSREQQWVSGVVQPIAETKESSGFEVDLGQAQTVDTILIEGLPSPFLKRVRLEGSGDRARWTLLVGEGTLFNLPQEALSQLSLQFLPGPYRYLRVTWNDTNSGRLPLPRAVTARSVGANAIAFEPLKASVVVERRTSEPEVSRYRLKLPAAGLPIVAVTLDVGSGHVFRRASVSEARLGRSVAAPVELGAARLSRVQRDGVSASALRIPIQRPREAELELVVQDGSNPALDLKDVSVELAELPWLYFESPGGQLTARYGNPSAVAPSYDLEAVRGRVKLGDVPQSSWGTPADAAVTAPEPSPYVPEAGAAIARDGFRYRRTIPDGPVGLTVMQLDAAVLAHSQGPASSFADLRIVDRSGRQIPYVLERREEPMSVPLTLRPAASTALAGTLTPSSPHNRSVYAITLPFAGLPSPRLVLETSDRVFQRGLQVAVERPADRDHRSVWLDVKAGTVWMHTVPEVAAQAAMLPLAVHDEREFLLVVDEGDNRPLAITRSSLLLPSWRVRFFRPASASGGLTLLYGHGTLQAPRYDLTLLAQQVMGAEAREVGAVAEEAARAEGGEAAAILSPRTFWIGLGAAVLVLIAIIGKLVAGPSAGSSQPSQPGP